MSCTIRELLLEPRRHAPGQTDWHGDRGLRKGDQRHHGESLVQAAPPLRMMKFIKTVTSAGTGVRVYSRHLDGLWCAFIASNV